MSSRKIERKNFNSPDETKSLEKAKAQIVKVGDFTIGRFTVEPGWKWSTHMKPIAKTDSCQLSHAGTLLSGKMMIAMDDGTKVEYGPGDVASISPGHDAWVVGNEPCVFVEFSGTSPEFGKPK